MLGMEAPTLDEIEICNVVAGQTRVLQEKEYQPLGSTGEKQRFGL